MSFLVLGALLAQQPKPAQTPAAGFHTRRPIEFHLAEETQEAGLLPVVDVGGKRTVFLHPKAELDDRDIMSARTAKDLFDQPCVIVRLTPDGLKKMNALMAANKGRFLAIAVDDHVVMAPMIEGDSLTDDQFEMTGGFTANTANALVKTLTKRIR